MRHGLPGPGFAETMLARYRWHSIKVGISTDLARIGLHHALWCDTGCYARTWAFPRRTPPMLVERQAVPGAGALWGGCDVGPGAGRASARFVSCSSKLFERSRA